MMCINVPKYVEQITSSINHCVASSWFSSSHITKVRGQTDVKPSFCTSRYGNTLIILKSSVKDTYRFYCQCLVFSMHYLLFMELNVALNLPSILYFLYYLKMVKPAETCCNEYKILAIKILVLIDGLL